MPDTFHNRKILLDRRRSLRRNQTDAEARLWYYVRDRRLCGLKFHRQYSIGPYILDFYCFEVKLAVELDGGQHASPELTVYDAIRTDFLVGQGIKVLRFWNPDVLRHPDSVLEEIYRNIEEILP